uniref:Histidine kinase n=1 Tax=Geobacter metallireducens TaxID=28232 RepID=A0A831U320_GEOME
MKKKVLAVSAACALSAATAVPALALENEFHGMFRVNGIVSNFGSEAGGTVLADLDNDAPTRSYIEQRARLMYIAKANDDLKLVTHFEIDSRWGDSAYKEKRNDGGAIGADQVNIETKNVYLDFNIPSTAINVKAGIQPFIDSMGGVFVNADMAGAIASAKYAGFTNSLGWFRLDEATATSALGRATRDLFILDSKYALTKDVKVGGSYYLLTNDISTENTYTHIVGLNAEAKFEPVTVNGFAAYQFGDVPGMAGDQSAFALGGTLRAKAGIGTAKAGFLAFSGEQDANPDNSGWSAISSAGGSENSFYASDMLILFRNKWNTSSDKAIINNFDNTGLAPGLVAAFAGYDANVTNKLFINGNAGFAWMHHKLGGDSRYIGTEINAEVGYKLFDNMTAMVQGGYFILGDGIQDVFNDLTGDDADDPYMARVVLNYAF